MGYCVNMKESTIGIRLKNANNIKNILKEYAKTKKDIAWVNNSELIYSEDVMESMCAIRYPLYIDTKTELLKIDFFNGEKLGDDFEIFAQIASYIEDGYIEYQGEDGDLWRYVFKDGKVSEVYPEIVWE